MSTIETVHDALVLLDIDGTTSDTAVHMTGLNERLAAQFPEVGEVLPHIRAQRSAFRKQYGHLSFAEQDEIWQQQYPGTTSHSQLDIYRTFAPDIFTEEKTAEISDWLADPKNFGSAEYDDVRPMMDGLQRIGAPAVLFTLGQYETSAGDPGWQQRKIAALSRLKKLESHVTPTLPERGKGQIIDESYDAKTDLFKFPLTAAKKVVARGAVMVDDSTHNLDIAEPGMGILIDRQGKKSNWEHPENIHVVQSLEQVPALVEEYSDLRRNTVQ